MDEEKPLVVVYPPDDQGGRRVRIDGQISGMAYSLADVIEFLRRAGWIDEESWPPIEWRDGGPEVWS
ncbi:hypothetical protein L1085_016235 [Streptomyces sp. MSC1_001]|jgi:hypothetical protein|uniref:hypothetical protein n=1 Tax=Streptomyces sp. MSC1_001 TaxID=2909263 RepID=UPI00202E66F0|nr:hypothetical protein [Streptomyces sp. MSC1_001]